MLWMRLELSAAALPIGPRRPTALREDEPQLGLGNARGKRIAQDKQRSAISASFLDVLTEQREYEQSRQQKRVQDEDYCF